MRQRKKRKSRSIMSLDIRKLYTGGVSSDLDRPIDVGIPTDIEVEIGLVSASWNPIRCTMTRWSFWATLTPGMATI